MGNRFSRRRDVLVNSTEQKAAGEPPAATQPGDQALLTPAQEAMEAENLDVVMGEPVQTVACLPTEECISECKEEVAPAAAATPDAAEPQPKEIEGPLQPEPLISVSTPSPAEPESAPKPEPAPEPEPEVEPKPEPEPELEPEPEPAEALELESAPEPVPVVDLVAPNVEADPSPAPVDADLPSDIPAAADFQDDDAKATVILAPELEKCEETSEVLDVELMEAEPVQNDVNEDSVSGLLQQLDLTGNNLIADLIHSDDVKIPDDIVDTSTSTELM